MKNPVAAAAGFFMRKKATFSLSKATFSLSSLCFVDGVAVPIVGGQVREPESVPDKLRVDGEVMFDAGKLPALR